MDSLVSGASAAFPQGPCAVDEFSNIIFDSGPPAPSSLTDAECTEDEFLLLTNPDDFTSDFHDVDVTEAAAPEADIAPGTAAAAAPTAVSPSLHGQAGFQIRVRAVIDYHTESRLILLSRRTYEGLGISLLPPGPGGPAALIPAPGNVKFHVPLVEAPQDFPE